MTISHESMTSFQSFVYLFIQSLLTTLKKLKVKFHIDQNLYRNNNLSEYLGVHT